MLIENLRSGEMVLPVGDSEITIDSIGSGKVLIVDDEEAVADLHTYRINRQYTGIPAYGGSEALAKIDRSFDVVLLDRRMPDMTGEEVLEQIRNDGYGVKVVMVTAIDIDETMLSMEFDDYISKPVGDNQLVDAVEYQLQLKRLDTVKEYLRQLKTKREKFETEYTTAQLKRSTAYTDLEEAIDQLSRLEDDLGDISA